MKITKTMSNKINKILKLGMRQQDLLNYLRQIKYMQMELNQYNEAYFDKKRQILEAFDIKIKKKFDLASDKNLKKLLTRCYLGNQPKSS